MNMPAIELEAFQEQLSKLVDDYLQPEDYKTMLAKTFSAHMSREEYATMNDFEEKAQRTCTALHRMVDFFDYLHKIQSKGHS